MAKECEVCGKQAPEPLVLRAGTPERDHFFCSSKCRDLFLRLEDDELEMYREKYLHKHE